MKLLVIVLCLLSERFLVHVSSHRRFEWFALYSKTMEKQFSRIYVLSSPWLMMLLALLPIVLVISLALYFCSSWLFGLIGLALNALIFYCCLGPANPFYPARTQTTEPVSEAELSTYLVQINSQLFAVLFWYIVLGPIAALVYRFTSQCQEQALVKKEATLLTGILDWLPARMTALLYLLVGNFQPGLKQFAGLLFSEPAKNPLVISSCGLQALGARAEETPTLPQAENLVEHAIIAFLVLLACFTLVAWM